MVGGQNKYANPLALAHTSSSAEAPTSPEFLDFADKYLPSFKHAVSRTLPLAEQDVVIKRSIEELAECIRDASFMPPPTTAQVAAATAAGNTGAGAFWAGYAFGLGGLQQMVVDLRYLGRSMGGAPPSSSSSPDEIKPGGFLTPRAAASLQATLRAALQAYSQRARQVLDEAWINSHLKWIDAAVEKRIANHANNKTSNSLAKMFAAEKEKVSLLCMLHNE
jgi:hypothetical protein